MKWRFLGSPRNQPDPEQERRIKQAQEKVAAIRERAERAVEALEGRHRRNHWTETVQDIVRRER